MSDTIYDLVHDEARADWRAEVDPGDARRDLVEEFLAQASPQEAAEWRGQWGRR